MTRRRIMLSARLVAGILAVGGRSSVAVEDAISFKGRTRAMLDGYDPERNATTGQ